MAATRSIVLSVRDTEHFKRLADPVNSRIFHAETLLPFTEAAKLVRGNANVRPPSDAKKPVKEMEDTVEETPGTFHLKNRGITYLCEKFEFDNARKALTIHLPKLGEDRYEDEEAPRFGIADGGHTFRVITRTVERIDDLKADDEWIEPFVRVHLLSGDTKEAQVEGIVEALNTSTQVKQYTLDEYNNAFDELKDALREAGFDPQLIAFRENEEKDWHVVEVIQRMACFLRERWVDTHPASMYRSKTKALELYTTENTRPEFRRLYGVIRDVITLPEFIQSQYSQAQLIPGRSFGALRAVKPLKQLTTPPGTDYPTKHTIDLAALLPMAAGFRELLTLKGDRYVWRVDPYEAFKRCAEQLHKALVTRSRTVRITSHLASDMEYWGACAGIVMRAQTQMLEERRK
jgi:hypothetical protein